LHLHPRHPRSPSHAEIARSLLLTKSTDIVDTHTYAITVTQRRYSTHFQQHFFVYQPFTSNTHTNILQYLYKTLTINNTAYTAKNIDFYIFANELNEDV